MVFALATGFMQANSYGLLPFSATVSRPSRPQLKLATTLRAASRFILLRRSGSLLKTA